MKTSKIGQMGPLTIENSHTKKKEKEKEKELKPKPKCFECYCFSLSFLVSLSDLIVLVLTHYWLTLDMFHDI